MSNLWWLSASAAELKAASTCRECGCGDADIDLELCFDCFSAKSGSEQWRRNAEIAAKYGLRNRVDECLRRSYEEALKEREDGGNQTCPASTG